MSVVLDASVTIDFCLRSEGSVYARSVLVHIIEHRALVPLVWPTEVANALLMARRRKGLPASECDEALALLSGIEVSIADDTALAHLRTVHHIGERFGLTGYDASYLSLAIQSGFALATGDAALRRAAEAAHVPLFGMAKPVALPSGSA